MENATALTTYTPSMLVATVTNFLLTLSVVIGFVWMVVGAPVALIIFWKNGKTHGFDQKLWLRVGLGGFILFGLAFVSYSVLYVIRVMSNSGFDQFS